MNDETQTNIHWSFWLIAGLTFVWNAMGVMNFFVQMNPEMVASFPESHQAIIKTRPVWATAGFAIAVFGGTIGCFLLLIKKSAAFYLFIASLVGVVVAMINAISIANSVVSFSTPDFIMMIVMPVVMAVFLVWYSRWVINKSWIN